MSGTFARSSPIRIKQKYMDEKSRYHWKNRLHEVIYETNTREGRLFNVLSMSLILLSILVVMLDSISSLHAKHGGLFLTLEWIFTIFFTIEYTLRLICIHRPVKYAFSFMGAIDLLSILPTYLSVIFTGAQSLMVLRALRLLRVFRILKLTHFIAEMRFLGAALRSSMNKITIFLVTVFMVVIVLGSVMYLVEGGHNGFDNIPLSIYWAIVTITTVGYGDISPVTPFGKLIASVIMIIGYSILAVPTGIITTEMTLAARKKQEKGEACPGCGRDAHDRDAVFCKYCGTKL